MRDGAREMRRAEIAEAAYALLAERGYGGTSMLAIAKRAKASNETLYRWYGDKAGLFRALIEGNAAAVKSGLEAALAEDRPPLETLADLAPRLLALLVSERAISLNRAAAADATGELGATLTEAGRGAVAPLIGQVVARGHAAGVLAPGDVGNAVRLFLDLLVGDLQIRRAIGAIPEPTANECAARAALANARFMRLSGPAS